MPFDDRGFLYAPPPPPEPTIAERMEKLFQGGKKWGVGDFYAGGAYCLLGALVAVTKNIRGHRVGMLSPDALPGFNHLARAVGGDQETRYMRIVLFNDNADGFEAIRAALRRMHKYEIAARERAAKKALISA